MCVCVCVCLSRQSEERVPCSCTGMPHPSADVQPGISLSHAKRRKTGNLLGARRCRLVVFGIEIGGRWSQETASFTRLLACQGPQRASSPSPGCASCLGAALERYCCCCCESAVAASLLDFGVGVATLAPCCELKSEAGSRVGALPRLAEASDGLTQVVWTASWAPCHSGKPLQTISIRRASATGTGRFISASRILRATRAPGSWQTRATARSSGRAQEAKAPELAQASRWTPSGREAAASAGGRAEAPETLRRGW